MPSMTTLSSILLAGTALALPHTFNPRAADGPQTVIYWGQNGGGVTENNDLSTYCTKESGIDMVVLAFLYQYGNNVTIPGGTVGQSCAISTSGEGQNCDDLAKAIKTCQTNGVKIIMSLGGAAGSYSLSSKEEAETIGQNLWDAYGNASSGGGGDGGGDDGGDGDGKGKGKGNSITKRAAVPRPFGDTFVNGWDFDIESNSGNQYYEFMIAKLRSNFEKDSANQYLITGAPQCPIPEPNMNVMITKAKFDDLFVQFYNNPACSITGTINYDDWKKNVAGTPSADAKIFLGLPASALGATGTESGAKYYLKPEDLATQVKKFSKDDQFGGVMLWSAGFSDANVNNNCTYAQEAKHILTNGSVC